MADAQNYYYKTITPIRWDQLAYAGYGDVAYTPDLLAVNQQIPSYDYIPAGVIITFPYIPEVSDMTLLSQLPAWKQ